MNACVRVCVCERAVRMYCAHLYVCGAPHTYIRTTHTHTHTLVSRCLSVRLNTTPAGTTRPIA